MTSLSKLSARLQRAESAFRDAYHRRGSATAMVEAAATIEEVAEAAAEHDDVPAVVAADCRRWAEYAEEVADGGSRRDYMMVADLGEYGLRFALTAPEECREFGQVYGGEVDEAVEDLGLRAEAVLCE